MDPSSLVLQQPPHPPPPMEQEQPQHNCVDQTSAQQTDDERNEAQKSNVDDDDAAAATAIQERLNSMQEAQWQIMFRALVDFMTNRMNLSGRASGNGPKQEEDPVLAEWANQQRLCMRALQHGILPNDSIFSRRHIHQLNGIGFDWDDLDSEELKWENMYQKLVAYKEKHGHCDVPMDLETQDLFLWMTSQQLKKIKLDLIGFKWLTKEEMNNATSNAKAPRGRPKKRAAESFPDGTETPNKKHTTGNANNADGAEARQPNGDTHVAIQELSESSEKANETSRIATAGHAQAADASELNNGGAAALAADNHGNDDDESHHESEHDSEEVKGLHKKYWNEMFEKLLKYKEEHGDTRVPRKFPPDQKLARWVDQQARDFKAGKISDERMEKLTSIGFDFGSRRQRDEWDVMFYQLVGYKKASGKTRVSKKKSKDDADREGQDNRLAKWVDAQRRLKRLNKLSHIQIKRLESIGFEWNAIADKWEQMYNRLLVYKEANGHCMVPQRHSADGNLGEWVRTQRRFNRKGTLSQDKIERLNAIGFTWAAPTNPPHKKKRTPKAQKRR